MNEATKPLGEIEREYLATTANLTDDERTAAQQEVRRFVRWFGGDRVLTTLRPSDIERYAEEVSKTASGASNKLQPVRTFLAYARKQGYTIENLGTHVRIRRTNTKRDKGPAVRESAAIQMTAEGLDKLHGELDTLKSQRPLIAEELARAMADKDFRENAPLDAARDRQAQVEARIREVERTLRHAVVVDSARETERVTLGRAVILQEEGDTDEIRYVLVSPNEVDIRQGRISTASPTGKALLDRAVGDEIEVTAPMGMVRYKILRVE